jgi:hypothetical protein
MAPPVAGEPVEFRACEVQQRCNPVWLDGQRRRDQPVVRARLMQTQCNGQRERKLPDQFGTVHPCTVSRQLPALTGNAVLHLRRTGDAVVGTGKCSSALRKTRPRPTSILVIVIPLPTVRNPQPHLTRPGRN